MQKVKIFKMTSRHLLEEDVNKWLEAHAVTVQQMVVSNGHLIILYTEKKGVAKK